MKKNWKAVLVAAVLAVAFGAYSFAFAGNGVPQKSTLTGQVVAEGLVVKGQKVNQGDVLVKVKTIAGAMPAARATVGGMVEDVYVTAGENISSNQPVASITE